MKSIAFLLISPFTKRDYDRFGIEILKKNFNVYVLDMNKLYGTDLKREYKIYFFKNYYSISTVEEFKKICTQLKLNYAIDFLSISNVSHKLRNFLKKKNVSITKVQNGLQPRFNPKNYLINRVYENIFKLRSWKNIFFSIQKLNNPNTYFFSNEILVGGLSGLKLVAAKYSKNIIPCHSFDYDIYLRLIDKKKIINKKYLIFVDQNLAFHPDIEFLKLKKIVSPKIYYKALESFFIKVEEYYGFKLIVAAHPRSNYQLYPNIFKNREIIKGKTAELIKNCEHVFMHASNALSYAVLYRKPISFITTNEINNSSFSKSMNVFSKFFSKKYLNIDSFNKNEFDENLDNPIENSVYELYEREFLIHPDSPKKLFWEIYSDYILNKK